MRVKLLHRARDFEVKPELNDPIFQAMLSGNLWALANVKRDLERGKLEVAVAPTGNDAVLTQDLELDTLWKAMAAGDEFIFETVKRVLLTSLSEPDAIVYRQGVLADCLEHPAIIQQLHDLAVEALASERSVGFLWHNAGPDLILSRSVSVLKLHLEALRRLRQIADQHTANFRSEGFQQLFATLRDELADDYLDAVDHQLTELGFRRGVLESAEFGRGFKGHNYTVHVPHEQRRGLPFTRGKRPPSFSFTIPPRDDSGFRSLEAIRGKGINAVANAVAQSADHVTNFFTMLRFELAFYLGCMRLHEWLRQKGEPTCFPEPLPADTLALTADGLYDVCLTLHAHDQVVGNSVHADNRSLLIITGANQGGKSTFLRSLGVAQLMFQSGMFVGAQAFRAAVCHGLFTHFKREEDETMRGGKLDEELARMSLIAEGISRRSLLLCNESFASTNEREGAEIARQVVRAMLARNIRVFFVTHMYDLAHGYYNLGLDSALFLRAERLGDGSRTFKLVEGEPLPTSYGEDSYRRVFAARPARVDTEATDSSGASVHSGTRAEP